MASGTYLHEQRSNPVWVAALQTASSAVAICHLKIDCSQAFSVKYVKLYT